jgi:hypothetical protein
MNERDAKALLVRLFSCPEAAQSFWAHRISLQFPCPRCRGDVCKSMIPAAFGSGPTLYVFCCGCTVEVYRDDFTTAAHWPSIVRKRAQLGP